MRTCPNCKLCVYRSRLMSFFALPSLAMPTAFASRSLDVRLRFGWGFLISFSWAFVMCFQTRQDACIDSSAEHPGAGSLFTEPLTIVQHSGVPAPIQGCVCHNAHTFDTGNSGVCMINMRIADNSSLCDVTIGVACAVASRCERACAHVACA
jgi:hypothetical protein